MTISKLVSIVFWNIHSLGYKLLEPDLRNFLSNFDIVCLCETWLSDLDDNNDKVQLPGYKYRLFNRQRIRLQGRHSGGILIMWKDYLDDNMCIVDCSSEYVYFNIGNDSFVFAYAAPPDSTQMLREYNPMEKLESLLYENRCGNLRYFGDLNARTGSLIDSEIDITEKIPTRNNKDKNTNAQGRRLASICKTCGYCIVNGRLGNIDETSNFTYRAKTGNSVIDYLIVPALKLDMVKNFHIYDRVESDHIPLSFQTEVSIKTNATQVTRPDNHSRHSVTSQARRNPGQDRIARYVWRYELADSYRTKLTNQLINMAPGDVNNTVSNINTAILESASDMKQKQRKSTPDQRHKNHPWFDDECSRVKKDVVESFKMNIKHRTHENQTRYNEIKKRYNKLKRLKCRKYHNEFVRSLLTDKRENPKKFWEKFQWKSKSTKIGASREDLQTHFRNVFENPVTNMDRGWEEYVCKFNDWWRVHGEDQTSEILDGEITEEEIETSLKKLKSGKSPGMDSLIPEFFKTTQDILIPTLKLLFNEILQSGNYPALWQHQLLTPVYKKGDVTDPNNYRGISLTSIFSKIFLNIIYIRIESFSTRHRLISDEQGGFKKGRWTIDNIFTLHCYIKAALKKKNGHLYALFIDYSKCFDTISRNGLWYKLIKLGFSKKCVKLLMSVYSQVDLHLKYCGSIGEEIRSNIGLKQGCPLSAILYSLYSNDITVALSQNLDTDQLQLPNVLMFADDTVVFSECANRMKILIKNLESYTNKWGLKINLDKTKLMVFRNKNADGKKLEVEFTLNNEKISYVDNYRYLGIVFQYTGSWTEQLSEAKTKGHRASLILREKLRKAYSLPIKDTLDLYKSCVQSGLLYGCEIWGNMNTDSIESIQSDFAKYILGLRQSTPNLGTLAELGLLPYKRFIVYRVIKFWIRLLTEDLPLQRQAYNYLMKSKGNNWTTFVKNNLDNLGFSYVWLDQGVEDLDHFLNVLLRKIKDCHVQDYDALVRTMPRLKLLQYLQIDPCNLSQYLRMPLSPFIRKQLARIRLSSHNLVIETGRWRKPSPIPRDERLCTTCNLGVIDDEVHFIYECDHPEIESLRRIHVCVTDNQKTIDDLRILLMSADTATQRHLALFCYRAQCIKQKLIL